MSKPDDIPQDVWDKAFHEMDCHCPAVMFGDDTLQQSVNTAIARAIMSAVIAENEACAQVLEFGFSRYGVTHKTDECSHGRFGYEDCELCAAVAIRKRVED